MEKNKDLLERIVRRSYLQLQESKTNLSVRQNMETDGEKIIFY